MKSYRLTRGDRRRLQTEGGALAEEIAAGEYDDPNRDFSDAQWYDLKGRNGAVYEVKSTATQLGNGRNGRFRLWQPQHVGLVRRDRRATSWYIFVLYDVSEPDVVAHLKRVKPARVGRLIGARGGWNRSGHPAGKQHKLPHSALFDR